MTEGKRISGFTMYRKTLIFNLPRIPFTILGIFVGGSIPFLIQKIFTGGPPSALVTTIGSLLGVFLYKQIANFGRYQYQTAQIAIITHAIRRNTIHDRPFQTGMKLVRLNYETDSVIGFVAILLYATVQRFMKKERFMDALRVRGGDFIAYIRAVSVMMMTNLLPYCGYCATSWDFSHPDEYMLESVCNGTELFLKNFRRILPCLLSIIFLRTIQISVTFLVAIFFFAIFLKRDADYIYQIQEWSQYVGFSSYETTSVFIQVVVILTAGVILLVNLFFQPIDIIRLLRKVYKVADNKQPEGSIYRRFEKSIERVSTKRRKFVYEKRLIRQNELELEKKAQPPGSDVKEGKTGKPLSNGKTTA